MQTVFTRFPLSLRNQFPTFPDRGRRCYQHYQTRQVHFYLFIACSASSPTPTPFQCHLLVTDTNLFFILFSFATDSSTTLLITLQEKACNIFCTMWMTHHFPWPSTSPPHFFRVSRNPISLHIVSSSCRSQRITDISKQWLMWSETKLEDPHVSLG